MPELKNYMMYCIDCDSDVEHTDLKEDGDEGVFELFCPTCGSNHFGFYREV